MSKVISTKPVLIMLYGYPGSGKTHFARQLSETLQAAHVHGDRIRGELFDKPQYDTHENEIVNHLMIYMAEEFLKAGVSVIFDANSDRVSHRREMRNVARKIKAETLLVWLQIDSASAYARLGRRDKRKTDDKYSTPYTPDTFEKYIQKMQNPKNEEYIVVSGKHTFNTQRSAVVKKLYEIGAIAIEEANSGVVKPGLVNLIPNQLRGGRVDNSRRNILIR
ncbi:MAG: ATP-binding protein [Candidatus Saccharibacteria bacterium]|nr:ATP-binding protein [Candidatus Saccharibacteria bacterium]